MCSAYVSKCQLCAGALSRYGVHWSQAAVKPHDLDTENQSQVSG